MRVVRSFEPPCCAHHNYSLRPAVSGGSQLESRRREMYAERKAGGAPCTIVTQRSCMRTYDIIVNISGLVNKARWYPRGWPESRLNPEGSGGARTRAPSEGRRVPSPAPRRSETNNTRPFPEGGRPVPGGRHALAPRYERIRAVSSPAASGAPRSRALARIAAHGNARPSSIGEQISLIGQYTSRVSLVEKSPPTVPHNRLPPRAGLPVERAFN